MPFLILSARFLVYLTLLLPCHLALAAPESETSAAASYLDQGKRNIEQGRLAEGTALFAQAAQLLSAVPDSAAKANLLLALGLAYGNTQAPKNVAAGLFLAASRIGDVLGDKLLVSSGLGYLAELYEGEQRSAEALQLARRAAFAAQEADEPRLLYQWQWLSGRLLRALGESEAALLSYRLAIATVRTVRETSGGQCQDGPATVRRPLAILYQEAVDLLLRRAAAESDPEKRAHSWREARETLELLKASELRDFFQDECLAALQAKTTTLETIGAHTAVIYPVILPDRTELLTNIGGRLQSYLVPLSAKELSGEVNKLRFALEKRTTSEYLPQAKRLYDLLLRPMAAELAAAAIDTLVIVPDGALRTIPFDVLHDGESFLVAKYAVAVTPGLDLTDPRPLPRQGVHTLAVGITEGVQGFPPLDHVNQELTDFHTLYGGRQLLNREFKVAALEKVLREEPIGMIHLASHGQFGHDLASTFLLAYDDKLTMERLNQYVGMFRFRSEPLEMLTLSACQTAAGDDRAALGLAGVAIRAGARSALATLWYINDQASSTLISEFYRQLQTPGLSKAEALRRAKVSLLADRRYRHPAYWAPFLLINNWL